MDLFLIRKSQWEKTSSFLFFLQISKINFLFDQSQIKIWRYLTLVKHFRYDSNKILLRKICILFTYSWYTIRYFNFSLQTQTKNKISKSVRQENFFDFFQQKRTKNKLVLFRRSLKKWFPLVITLSFKILDSPLVKLIRVFTLILWLFFIT